MTEQAEANVAEAATEEAAPKTATGKDIVPAKYRDMYAANKGTCGDFIASELSAVMDGGVDMLKGVKKANGIAESAWSGLNNGQQRMNLSNALRTAYLRGTEIDILGKKFSLATHMEEFDGGRNFDGNNEGQVRKFLAFIDMPDNTRNTRAIKKFFHDDPAKALATAERKEKAEAAKKAKEDEKAAKAAAKAAEPAADKPKKESKGKASTKGEAPAADAA